MEKGLKSSSNEITISEFYENNLLKKYDYNPPYQRKSIWGEEKKQFLIDSILKNFPIPPVFLKSKLDNKTGKTTYDVIDGKQRLTAILEFIDGKILIPETIADEPFANETLVNLSFSELDRYDDYKAMFWSYKIPIVYIDQGVEEDIIKNIFDRLNRNGEPLTPQQLRNAKYVGTSFLAVIRKLVENGFWKERLQVLSSDREEDLEFISELVFLLLEENILDSKNEIIDQLYEKWEAKFQEKPERADKLQSEFNIVTKYMESLDIDYDGCKVKGISHLYAIWSLSYLCIKQGINADDIKEYLKMLFEAYRDKKYQDHPAIVNYKRSMNAGTRQRSQRILRLNAILKYCEEMSKGKIVIQNSYSQ